MKKFSSGYIHSIETMGLVDGPGIRVVVFMQGCPLRCSFCHNPDTWETEGGTVYTPEALLAEAVRFREYFAHGGGVTLSGGEPLLQASFAAAYFRLCKENGLSTCLDTSGCILNDGVRALLSVTDRVLLDIKYPSDEGYRKHVGCSLSAPLAFLSELENRKIPTTLRTVVIPTLTDTEEHEAFLAQLARTHACVDAVECLPFKKICSVKYESMGIPFPFADIPAADAQAALAMQTRITSHIVKQ